jgi:hypothetical protein
MLRACRHSVDGLYLIRCTEPFVNQLTMIRGFAGHGHVVSFYAPYVCSDCSTAYSALLDAERDREDLLAMTAPKTWCPRCGGPGTFDDEEGSYFSVLGQLAETVPPQIRRTLSAMDPVVAVDAVEKRVDGDVTRISVFVPADGSVRWNQILEGSEGKLVIDFTRATTSTAEGADTLERALKRIAEDVDSVALIATPRWVAMRLLGASGLPRIDVWSLTADAHCPQCNAARTVSVEVADHAALLLRGDDPKMPCPRCGTALSFEPSRAVLRLITLHGRPGDRTAEIPRPKAPIVGPPTLLETELGPPRPPPPPPPSESPRNLFAAAMVGGSTALFAVAVVLLVVTLSLAGWWVWIKPAQEAANAQPPEVGAVLPPVSAVPPSWVENPVNLGSDSVRVVGHATASATQDAGLARARNDALAALVRQILADLDDSPVQAFVSSRVLGTLGADDVERVAKRFLDQEGARAPQRIDRFVRDTPFGMEVWGLYELPRATYDELLTSYGRTGEGLGMRVAPFFPLLQATVRASSEVVVLSVEANPAKKAKVLPGELVKSIDGEPVRSVDGFQALVKERMGKRGAAIEVELEMNGATRKLALPKTRSAPPTP